MPEKIATTHVLMANELVVYRRERSTIWQCRYKVDNIWQRASTNERDLKQAKRKARELLITAEIRKRENLPVVTRKFRDVAKLTIDRMDTELAAGGGKVTYADYTSVIRDYLIPFLGKLSIVSIDYNVLEELNDWRMLVMGKEPSRSTMLTHNAALLRVFAEGQMRGFVAKANIPVLVAKGKKSERRPAFELNEVRALLGNFEAWIDRARDERSKELRQLLCDYVTVLLDTGARPGKELFNLKWKQLLYAKKPVQVDTGVTAVEEPSDTPTGNIFVTDWNQTCELTVTGKTGTRQVMSRENAVNAFIRIGLRNYGKKEHVYKDQLKEIIAEHGEDYVFRTKAKVKPTSFQNLFESYLVEHNLFIDPSTEQNRVLYSLRHTYATLELTNDKTPIRTLAHQMGTSVGMIEKHYDHLKIGQAIDQLRGATTRKLLNDGTPIDARYRPNLKVKAG